MLDGNTAALKKHLREQDERDADFKADFDKYDTEAREQAELDLKNQDWWNGRLDGFNKVSRQVPETLARCMTNLDAACNGDEIARNAILTALSQLQKESRADAYDYAMERHA